MVLCQHGVLLLLYYFLKKAALRIDAAGPVLAAVAAACPTDLPICCCHSGHGGDAGGGGGGGGGCPSEVESRRPAELLPLKPLLDRATVRAPAAGVLPCLQCRETSDYVGSRPAQQRGLCTITIYQNRHYADSPPCWNLRDFTSHCPGGGPMLADALAACTQLGPLRAHVLTPVLLFRVCTMCVCARVCMPRLRPNR